MADSFWEDDMKRIKERQRARHAEELFTASNDLAYYSGDVRYDAQVEEQLDARDWTDDSAFGNPGAAQLDALLGEPELYPDPRDVRE